MSKVAEDLPLQEKLAAGRSNLVDVKNMPWSPAPFPGVQIKVLFNDPATGMSTVMVKIEPGAKIPLHEHTGIEQAFVLEGSIVDHDGEVTAGNYTWRTAGSKHVNTAPNGAVVLGFFTRPNSFYGGHEHIADYKPDVAKKA
jgi:anti-sigma factor ChrR (cupin superfamily)